jgi:soluble lytic murein transglycosylase
MAADRANLPYRLDHRPVTAADVRQAAAKPGMQYARELYFLGRLGDAAREINWTTKTANNKAVQRGAASMVKQWGWTNRAIHTLLRSRYWDDLEIRFPLDYQRLVKQEAKNNDIDPAWIFAIMRQESMFDKNAHSPVGALGLMQLMPPTARLVARKVGMKKPSKSIILQPSTNIRLGSRYLKMLSDQFRGHHILAIPGYNAGPHRAQTWMKRSAPVDIWIESIPFDETRLYVKRVLSYWVLYDYRLGNKNPKRLRDRIPAYISPALVGRASKSSKSKGKKKKSSGVNPVLKF